MTKISKNSYHYEYRVRFGFQDDFFVQDKALFIIHQEAQCLIMVSILLPCY